MITTTEELISPEIAKEYLSHIDVQKKNRPLNKRYVDMYARDMIAGKWKTTHQGIAFDENGYLVDGQHRLNAIIQANIPIKLMVSRGLGNNPFSGIDSGLRRSMRDIIALSGEFDQSSELRNNSVIASIRALVNCGYKNGFTLSPNAVEKIYSTLKPKFDFVYHSLICKGICKNAHMSAAGVSALLNGETDSDVYNFFLCMEKSDISGCEGKNVAAPLGWNKQILDLRAKRVRMTRDKLYIGTQIAIWNFCKNTDIKQIRTMNNFKYPVSDILHNILSEFENNDQ